MHALTRLVQSAWLSQRERGEKNANLWRGGVVPFQREKRGVETIAHYGNVQIRTAQPLTVTTLFPRGETATDSIGSASPLNPRSNLPDRA